MKMEYMYLGVLKTKIIKILWRNNRMTRDELTEKLSYARTTVFDNLVKNKDSLLRRGIVGKEVLNSNGGLGRPPTVWFLTPNFILEMEVELDNETT